MKKGEEKETASARNPFAKEFLVEKVTIGTGEDEVIMGDDILHWDWQKRLIPPKKGFPLWQIHWAEDTGEIDKRTKKAVLKIRVLLINNAVPLKIEAQQLDLGEGEEVPNEE